MYLYNAQYFVNEVVLHLNLRSEEPLQIQVPTVPTSYFPTPHPSLISSNLTTMQLLSLAGLSVTLIGLANAGTVLWDGRFNDLSSSTDLDDWSWSNEVGPYQYYIHGPGNVTEYINLSPAYKNPADTSSNQGAKFTLDSTAYWEGQTMRRTELIPQTTAAINSGKVWYHFSMLANSTNFPSIYREHQICFFESHFTEMKAGWISGESGTSDTNLRWDVNSVTQWSTNFTAGVWHNIAYVCY